MRTDAGRRRLLAHLTGILTVAATGFSARASESPVELEWDDLIPADQQGLLIDTLKGLGIVEHGQLSTPFDQEAAKAVVTDYNGKLVRIPGYAVPLDFEGVAISTFILVPYIGACIHVPPPPANQLIFVEAEQPFESESMWDPIYATGKLSSSAVTTELAEVGYAMSGATIEPYSW
ncbi:DUF3299 domain-containing protein [Rhodobacteraceae bacterium NNCM2]|nr:DUF3299 domain-containing protein [Coraliihabitans acroporae]